MFIILSEPIIMATKKHILIIGAGRSAHHLIKELANYAKQNDHVELQVTDMDRNRLDELQKEIPVSTFVSNVVEAEDRADLLKPFDIVVSMLPAHLHINVIKTCVELGVHVATASYLSDEIKSLHEDAEKAGVTVLSELGLDPGIDHLSAMEMLDRIRSQGGEIKQFESFTGGLIAPESDTNPWGYKFTWNPRNVVLAGQGGAVKFIQEGRYKFIPYHKLFRRTEIIDIQGYGKFEGYANRDSLKYREIYGLEDVETMFRGTLRRPGFCRAWDVFVQLGATDDSYELPDMESMTHRQFINTFLAYHESDSVELKLRQYLNIQQDDVALWEKLEYLDLFSDELVGLESGSPAQALLAILSKKWSLAPHDRDMIVMWHKLIYADSTGKLHERHASFVHEGEDPRSTAMSKTVGLPLAFGVQLLSEGLIERPGCILPVTPDIYLPILERLKQRGVHFVERDLT